MTAVDAGARPGDRDDPAAAAPQAHRQIVLALSGLFLAMLVAMLSSTIVANALPPILADLNGSQSQYVWVVTATLLTATASTPIWGKLADRTSKKTLVQIAIVIFVGSSVLAGFAWNTEALITFRALQGLGMGGLQSLVQIVLGSLVSARERGRYMGYYGVVMGVALVGGPLLGGLIVDVPFLGWRWCFWVGVPVGLVAMFVLHRTLHLPVLRRDTAIDWWGALLIPGGTSVLLVWVTLAGQYIAWTSWPSLAMATVGVAIIAVAIVVERRVADPVVPPWLMRNRTVVLVIVISLATGVSVFGASVFLGQYFQLARGYSPTVAGLLTMPMTFALVVATIVSGRLVSRTGRWKRFLVAGTGLMATGLALLATIDHATALGRIGGYLVVTGVGVGMVLQNVILAVQNAVPYRELGVATSTVTLFRTLGGATGTSVLGAVLVARVTGVVRDRLGAGTAAQELGSLDLSALPPAIRQVVEHAYGDGTGVVFLVGAVFAVMAFVAAVSLRETALRTTVGDAAVETAMR